MIFLVSFFVFYLIIQTALKIEEFIEWFEDDSLLF